MELKKVLLKCQMSIHIYCAPVYIFVFHKCIKLLMCLLFIFMYQIITVHIVYVFFPVNNIFKEKCVPLINLN